MKRTNSIDLSPKKVAKIKGLLDRIDAIIDSALQLEKSYKNKLKKVHPEYQRSARNLIHYQALRSHDLNDLQKGLGNLGLTRMARIQSHVLSSLYTNQAILKFFLGKKMKYGRKGVSAKKANRILKKNAKNLVGYRSKGRRTRIMVTLPSEAAHDYQMVKAMIANGMNCARINCAHDDAVAWAKMIKHVRNASKQLKNECKVAMDLAGPKIRTGAIVAGPKIIKLRPSKNNRGEIVQPLRILITDQIECAQDMPIVPVSGEDLEKLSKDVVLKFLDARNKKRQLKIIERHEKGWIASCHKTAYLETGMILRTKKSKNKIEVIVGDIPPIEMSIHLHKGDVLRVDRTGIIGDGATYTSDGEVLANAHISCTLPEVFEDTKLGEPVLFDDGKIGGFIQSINDTHVEVEINHTMEKGGKLKADKGMNFPLSHLNLTGLTDKDLDDLDFVVAHADVVNMSFVNCVDDIQQLLNALKKRKVSNKMGIVLKIETQRGFNNLTEILLTAMQNYPIGVMIARGDLAVECGWKNIGRIQMEILSMCLAANVTDIWATQVLENLAKKGVPSRSEITDVVEAQQADCVMLNKGPYILESIKLLDSILRNMEPYREKNIVFSPALTKIMN